MTWIRLSSQTQTDPGVPTDHSDRRHRLLMTMMTMTVMALTEVVNRFWPRRRRTTLPSRQALLRTSHRLPRLLSSRQRSPMNRHHH